MSSGQSVYYPTSMTAVQDQDLFVINTVNEQILLDRMFAAEVKVSFVTSLWRVLLIVHPQTHSCNCVFCLWIRITVLFTASASTATSEHYWFDCLRLVDNWQPILLDYIFFLVKENANTVGSIHSWLYSKNTFDCVDNVCNNSASKVSAWEAKFQRLRSMTHKIYC